MIKAAAKDFQQQLLPLYSEREAWYITHLVFEQVTGLSRLDIITRPETTLTAEQEQEIADKLAQLRQHEPVQYVLHECFFYHLPFYVDKNVLIPRPETEELVEWAIRTQESRSRSLRPDQPFTALDVGTGSGCIAIAFKTNIPGAKVIAMDNSVGALQVARKNAEKNKADIEFIQADLMQNNWIKDLTVLDVIISNPPYIPRSEQARMQQRVTGYEPDQALFVPDEDPLLFYKRIIHLAGKKLQPGGDLFFEIHEDFAKPALHLLEKNGFAGVLKKDMNGRDRMIRASLVSGR